MKIELTRELLERYLRATGWTLCVVNMEWHKTNDEGVVRSFPYGWTSDVGLIEGAVLGSLGFKLGLCAAAESRADELQRFREYDKARPDPDPGENRGYWAGRVDEIERTRMTLLCAAGIEPDAWEASR